MKPNKIHGPRMTFEQILRDAARKGWGKRVSIKNPSPFPRKKPSKPAQETCGKKLTGKKLRVTHETVSKAKSKILPVYVNRNQLAEAVQISVRRMYEADVPADAVDIKGSPLFFAHRITEISQLLKTPKIV